MPAAKAVSVSLLSSRKDWSAVIVGMYLRRLRKSAQAENSALRVYGVHPAALLFAPPGGQEFERMQRAAHVISQADEETAEDWLKMGEKLTKSTPKA